MINILSKISKVFLVVFIFILLITFFPFLESMAFYYLWITPLFWLITLIFLTNDIKKSTKSLTHKLISIILLNIIIFSSIILFLGLNLSSFIHMELGILLVYYFYWFIIILSLLIDIILLVKNKELIYNNFPKNNVLLVFALFFLIIIFQSQIITSVSVLFKNPNLCTLQIEINNSWFMLSENSVDSCVNSVVRNSKITTIDSCDLIKNNFYKYWCIRRIALNTGDISYCYNIEKKENERWISISSCLMQVAVKSGDLSICELKEIEVRDSCINEVNSVGRD